MAGSNTRKELTEKQIAYVIWAATPDGLRVPETQEKFGTKMNVSRPTLWRWSKDPRVLDAIRYIALQNAGDPRRVNQILDMVFDTAIKGNSLKAAELWLKGVGIFGQFTRGNSVLEALEDDDNFADFSTEELERLEQEALAETAENKAINQAAVALLNSGVAPGAL